MRADYDSQADSVEIELRQFDRYEHQEWVDDDYCVVAFADGEPTKVCLLGPAEHLDLLDAAAERYYLNGTALRAATQAALAAPDRIVTIDVSAPIAA